MEIDGQKVSAKFFCVRSGVDHQCCRKGIVNSAHEPNGPHSNREGIIVSVMMS